MLLDGVRYESAPTALRRVAPGRAGQQGAVVIERRRSRLRSGSAPRREVDLITLTECDAGTLADEAADAGFALLGVDAIPPTREHAGSEIVCLEAI